MSTWIQRAAGVRAVDRELIDVVGIPGAVLMDQAGAGVAREIERWAGARGLERPRTLILCGPGNNGGDGYVVARYLHLAGWHVRAVAGFPPSSPDCIAFHRVCENLGLVGSEDDLAGADLVIDAVFGNGQRPGTPDAGWDRYAGPPLVALDVPTGVDADTGALLGPSPAHVDHVVTIGRAKPFLFAGGWLARSTGSWALVDIGFGDRGKPDALLWTAPPGLPAIPSSANKWDRGHVAVVAGCVETPGAAVLTCRAALRTGAGLVTLHAAVGARLDGLPPEVMVSHHPLRADGTDRYSTIIVGPGLGRGRDEDVRWLWDNVKVPMVFDADALRVAGLGEPAGLRLLTPHAGEAAAWLGTKGSGYLALEADRFATVQRLRGPKIAAIYKGACPLVTGDVPTVHEGRCEALGTAGSGDVLAGICGALLGRLRPKTVEDVERAANIAVAAHLGAGRRLRAGAFAGEIADAVAELPSLPVGSGA